MCVNTGGDAGRDDYGLPPVDVEVPDDARELDRDVQAYHRELRARRRHIRAKKLYGPLAKDGMVLPLLAGCLALTLLAATLLTVFTASRGTVGGPLGRPSTGARKAPVHVLPGAALLNSIVSVDGYPEQLSALEGPVLVLALVPRGCRARCVHDLRELIIEASHGGGMPYLVGINGEQVSWLPRKLGLGASQALEDTGNMVSQRYPTTHLTAIVVRRDGSAIQVRYDLGHGFQITDVVRTLASPAASSSGASGSGASSSGTKSSGASSSGTSNSGARSSGVRAGGQPTATAMS
jgi:uncharacterized membrane protein YgcG